MIREWEFELLISTEQKEKARVFALEAAKILIGRHCSDVVVLDLCGKSQAMEYLVIGTGTSDRQTRSVADEVATEGKPMGFKVFGKAGYEEGKWVLVDFVDVVVHIFDREFRDHYNLEMLWGDSQKLDLGEYLPDETDN